MCFGLFFLFRTWRGQVYFSVLSSLNTGALILSRSESQSENARRSRGFHFRRTAPFPLISERFQKKEIGTHSSREPTTRPKADRTRRELIFPAQETAMQLRLFCLGPESKTVHDNEGSKSQLRNRLASLFLPGQKIFRMSGTVRACTAYYAVVRSITRVPNQSGASR